jgi:hypothetical protein
MGQLARLHINSHAMGVVRRSEGHGPVALFPGRDFYWPARGCIEVG